MSAGTSRPETRADLRDRDQHYSWREVYTALHASSGADVHGGDHDGP